LKNGQKEIILLKGLCWIDPRRDGDMFEEEIRKKMEEEEKKKLLHSIGYDHMTPQAKEEMLKMGAKEMGIEYKPKQKKNDTRRMTYLDRKHGDKE